MSIISNVLCSPAPEEFITGDYGPPRTTTNTKHHKREANDRVSKANARSGDEHEYLERKSGRQRRKNLPSFDRNGSHRFRHLFKWKQKIAREWFHSEKAVNFIRQSTYHRRTMRLGPSCSPVPESHTTAEVLEL